MHKGPNFSYYHAICALICHKMVNFSAFNFTEKAAFSITYPSNFGELVVKLCIFCRLTHCSFCFWKCGICFQIISQNVPTSKSSLPEQKVEFEPFPVVGKPCQQGIRGHLIHLTSSSRSRRTQSGFVWPDLFWRQTSVFCSAWSGRSGPDCHPR